MSKYFGKCFGPSTRAPKFSTQIPWLFIIRICFTIKAWRKLIQFVVRVGIVRIFVTSSILMVLYSGFWASGSQFPSLMTQFHGPECQGPSSRVQCLWVSEFQSLGSQGPGSRVSGFKVSGFQGPRVLRFQGSRSQGPESLVSGPDFRLCRLSSNKTHS